MDAKNGPYQIQRDYNANKSAWRWWVIDTRTNEKVTRKFMKYQDAIEMQRIMNIGTSEKK